MGKYFDLFTVNSKEFPVFLQESFFKGIFPGFLFVVRELI